MNVKTTIELPEGLVAEAKRRAVDESTTLRELVIRGLELVVYPKQSASVAENTSAEYGQPYRLDGDGWPLLDSDVPEVVVTNEMVNQMREELGI